MVVASLTGYDTGEKQASFSVLGASWACIQDLLSTKILCQHSVEKTTGGLE